MLAVAIYAYARPQLDCGSRFINRVKAQYLARAGVKRAILELEKGDKTADYDAFGDTWDNNTGAFKEVDLGDGTFSTVNGSTGEPVYGLMDEERKININKSSYDILRRLLEAKEVEPETAASIAAAIIDWRDEDDNPYMDVGAENSHYNSLNPSYHCKNAGFNITEELLLLKNMTADIYKRIKDSITVYSEGPVNINTIDKTVMNALGIEEPLAEKILRFRGNGDDPEAVVNVFKDPGSAALALNAVETLSNGEIASLNKIFGQGLITVKSDVFSGRAIGRVKNRTDYYSITFVYDRNKKALRYWREE
ncbi:MAG: type II secretion system protein GspK [Candidatus Omnitrophica bacterium]|nr:type II secretion system protein GspK [Candidatus Omnitrophota bacterium]